MRQYSYEDIGDFLLDDGFYYWAKYGISKDGFEIEKFKERYQGREDEIEFAAALIRSLKIEESITATSEEYKKQRCDDLLAGLKDPEKRFSISRFTRKIFIRAACVLILLSIGIGFYFHYSFQGKESILLSDAEIDSLKKSNNVLIIMNDKTILEINDDHAEIKAEKDGSLLVNNVEMSNISRPDRDKELIISQIVVPYGKRSKMILPDSSCVWINSGSCISYQSDFLTNRELKVQGEVFLDVKKDEEHPFRVMSNRLDVCVLGTAFNVTDYENDLNSAVVLVRGSVKVKTGQGKENQLQPGQRLSVEKNQVEVKDVDVYSYVCWKDNKMNFNDQTLKEIIRSLSRYYNINIEVSGEYVDERCSGSLDLDNSFSEVLETISQVVPFYIERKGNTIYLSTYKN